MTKHRSFRISDFSLREVPWAVAAYIIIALLSTGVGVLLESLPKFWRGVLLGGGCVLTACYLLACYYRFGLATKEIDVASLPKPSARVVAKYDDPHCSLVDAVSVHREETGLELTEATAVVRNYHASRQRGERTKS